MDYKNRAYRALIPSLSFYTHPLINIYIFLSWPVDQANKENQVNEVAEGMEAVEAVAAVVAAMD